MDNQKVVDSVDVAACYWDFAVYFFPDHGKFQFHKCLFLIML